MGVLFALSLCNYAVRARVLLSNTFSGESVAQAARDFGQEDDITVLTIEPISVDESSVPEIVDNSAMSRSF